LLRTAGILFSAGSTPPRGLFSFPCAGRVQDVRLRRWRWSRGWKTSFAITCPKWPRLRPSS